MPEHRSPAAPRWPHRLRRALTGALWLPVVVLQLRMARMAAHALRTQTPLPPAYARCARWWEALGYPAFVAMLVVFWLMVAKPS